MEISPEELQELLGQPGPRPFRLVDVREEDEFAICRLESAELVPLAQLAALAPARWPDKEKPIVVYCHHGMRSSYAARLLNQLGYGMVYNLTGGIEAWADRLDPAMARY
jgi:rhodanese-related sulfurtransferase